MDDYFAIAGGAAGGAGAAIIAMFKYIGNKLDTKADAAHCHERHQKIDESIRMSTEGYCAMLAALNETKIAIARLESRLGAWMDAERSASRREQAPQ